MKKYLVATTLLGASLAAHADAPGGPGCGWGNLLFEGQSGLGVHLMATITNGTSGNATFGMTSGTNGCDVSGSLSYNGTSMLAMNGVLEEVAHDMAAGQGEALTALSVSMGIAPEHRTHFNQLMHSHFNSIFPRQDVTAEQVMAEIVEVMRGDDTMAGYLS
ncbi:MAG: hypothetical protein CMN28_16945 [Salinisphaeraceae bacterium]|jgi:hypothetical protein|nr:hypothetical protein [Salinisphaeraceae bacterium]